MKVNPAFPHDAYRFLVRSLRDEDETSTGGVLERYVLGVQSVWEDLHALTESLDTLHNVDTIGDDLLTYLKHHVGWTSELDHITSALTADELRKLIGLSVAFWKLKGTERGIKDALRLLAGRDVILWNWFSARWDVEAAGFWRLGQETDGCFALGGYSGQRDEWTSVIWVMDEVGVQHQLIYDLVDLHRPVGEVYLVAYADLVDDFRVGRGKFPPHPPSATDSTWDPDTYRMTLEPGAWIRVNVEGVSAWDEVVWRQQVMFEAVGDAVAIVFRYANDGDERYEANFGQDGTLSLTWYQGGVPTVVASGALPHALPVGEGQVIGVNVLKPAAGRLQVDLMVYEIAELSFTFDVLNGDLLPPGAWFVKHSGSSDVIELDNVIAYQLPLLADLVDGPGTASTTPGPPPPGPAVLTDWDAFDGWTLSSLWHFTRFR